MCPAKKNENFGPASSESCSFQHTRSEEYVDLNGTHLQRLAFLKEPVKLTAVAFELMQIENGLKRLLHFAHSGSNGELDVGKMLAQNLGAGNVIRVHVRLEHPAHLEVAGLDVGDNLLQEPR